MADKILNITESTRYFLYGGTKRRNTCINSFILNLLLCQMTYYIYLYNSTICKDNVIHNIIKIKDNKPLERRNYITT